jgi:hypothetical protein
VANEPVTKATVRKATGAAKATAPAATRPGTAAGAAVGQPSPSKALEPVSPGPSPRPPAGRAAAKSVERREHVTLALPLVGKVQLPHPNDMAYYGGIGALVALELLEWPAAVALAVGHALISQKHNRALSEFGEALEDA